MSEDTIRRLFSNKVFEDSESASVHRGPRELYARMGATGIGALVRAEISARSQTAHWGSGALDEKGKLFFPSLEIPKKVAKSIRGRPPIDGAKLSPRTPMEAVEEQERLLLEAHDYPTTPGCHCVAEAREIGGRAGQLVLDRCVVEGHHKGWWNRPEVLVQFSGSEDLETETEISSWEGIECPAHTIWEDETLPHNGNEDSDQKKFRVYNHDTLREDDSWKEDPGNKARNFHWRDMDLETVLDSTRKVYPVKLFGDATYPDRMGVEKKWVLPPTRFTVTRGEDLVEQFLTLEEVGTVISTRKPLMRWVSNPEHLGTSVTIRKTGREEKFWKRFPNYAGPVILTRYMTMKSDSCLLRPNPLVEAWDLPLREFHRPMVWIDTIANTLEGDFAFRGGWRNNIRVLHEFSDHRKLVTEIILETARSDGHHRGRAIQEGPVFRAKARRATSGCLRIKWYLGGLKARMYYCTACGEFPHVRDHIRGMDGFLQEMYTGKNAEKRLLMRCKKHRENVRPKGFRGKEECWKCVCCGKPVMNIGIPFTVTFKAPAQCPNCDGYGRHNSGCPTYRTDMWPVWVYRVKAYGRFSEEYVGWTRGENMARKPDSRNLDGVVPTLTSKFFN